VRRTLRYSDEMELGYLQGTTVFTRESFYMTW
jgi:hypothetical protein